MAKKAKSCPAWLATFADMMSLLMAIFVLLYAMSSVEEKKYIQAVESLNATLGGSDGLSEDQQLYINLIRSEGDGESDPTAPDKQETKVDDLHPLYEGLMETFAKNKNAKGIKAQFDSKQNQIKLVFPEEISFDPGRAKLKPRFSNLLKISFMLTTDPVSIKVVGHTDKRPVAGGRFNSNWELSSARAASVVVLLVDSGLIDASQAEAIGVADTQPVSRGDKLSDYAKNRRVEVLITSAKPQY